MGYLVYVDGKATGGSNGCLGSVGAGSDGREWYMRRGNNAYRTSELSDDEWACVQVTMDAFEELLGVQFSERERQGYVNVGRDQEMPRHNMHLTLAPFRIFMELPYDAAITRDNSTVYKIFNTLIGRGVPVIGAWVALHCVAFSRGRPIFHGRGDQAWFMDHIRYPSLDAEPMRLHYKVLFSRLVQMFPTLRGMGAKVGRSFDCYTKGYSMDTVGDVYSKSAKAAVPLRPVFDKFEEELANLELLPPNGYQQQDTEEVLSILEQIGKASADALVGLQEQAILKYYKDLPRVEAPSTEQEQAA